MERSIRLGKDFNVRWSIHRVMDGERRPYELAGKELVLQYRRPNGTLHEAKEWRFDGNIIIWTFRGRDQRAPGLYGLILTENGGKDGMVTVDTCRAFNLVEHSCEETDGSGGDIVIEDVVLESEVAFAPIVIEGGGGSYDDTEIKNQLAALQQKDAEQSAKLAQLSERVDELGQPIFKAVYGETKIEEIIAAYESGKVVHCDYNGLCYTLARISNGEAFLTANIGMFTYRLQCSANGIWAPNAYSLEIQSNKVTFLSSSSTDTQYPSAKAVYDALQNVGGGGSGGDDTSLREAIFGKTTSKEFAINGYHAATADTLEVNIAQGEVFHFRLETLGAAMTKYQLYVKYEGDSAQATLNYFLANENYSMYAKRPIVELGVQTSSLWVTEKGDVRLTVTQGGIKEPYNLMELGVITIEDSVDNIDVLEYIPDLLKFKKLKVLSQFTYSAERSKRGSIILNNENVNTGVALDNLMGSAVNTHYIFDLTFDINAICAYIECHSNSFENPQVQDSNLGKNLGKLKKGNPINAFVINLPLLVGDKFTFYGK